ncbi:MULTISPECIES: TetR/AcrR family transcriptional regulator [Myxococcus]|uniref:TetR/AcrR family transcriptional regulator n=1 Tax=Myxococcus llanfairpwllgwyngyllgogerychwyrndrobwllllantysiliogogogochensis TaxID=2590453 RepID=A0A540WVR0_9BACT|nr:MULTISPECIES: TetR/AcrR family transcriptional regulator [Myxococcus]NTX03742.1 TetR/AcrR family transcriptional regulator [Myxococcus sp. CA040A]NTX14095.1 TetR/AcrR family transcriptional regulator [Myxococcus sp. CA056]TQF13099.1 TetR/AcrR family transcriptional regulator [Myxococcus llanfairpwllgwyngyllgogerychwyrndrobwllllantysiliogogogochensis]
MPRTPSSRRKHPRQQRAQATCDAILTATARLLIRDGYEATTTNHIAQEAGVSIGSLYQYYPNKEGLVFAVLEHHGTRWLAELETALRDFASAPLNIAVRAIIQQILSSKRLRSQLDPLRHVLLPVLRPLGYVDTFEQQLSRLVRTFLAARLEDIRPRELDMAVFIIVHTLEALCHSAGMDRPDYLTNEAFPEELCALVLGYLRLEPAALSHPPHTSTAPRQKYEQ